jgi:anti-anti-sigma factor
MSKNLLLSIASEVGNDDYKVVKFSGEFDKAGYSEIKPNLDEVVQNFSAKNLIFDFGNLKFINSEGIGYLMEVHTHLMNRDKRLVIVDLNDHVKDIFTTIGISEIISVYDDLDSFLSK